MWPILVTFVLQTHSPIRKELNYKTTKTKLIGQAMNALCVVREKKFSFSLTATTTTAAR